MLESVSGFFFNILINILKHLYGSVYVLRTSDHVRNTIKLTHTNQ